MLPDFPFYSITVRADGTYSVTLNCPRRKTWFDLFDGPSYRSAVDLLRALEGRS